MEFELIVGYKDNKHYNSDLNNMIKKLSYSTFEEWMLKGRALETYTPVALVNEKNEILISSGFIKTKLNINNVACTAMQLGHIFVKEAYQKEDLETILLEKLMSKYENIMDIIYTYSDIQNDVILLENGFKQKQEYLYFLLWDSEREAGGSTIKKVDTENPKDIELITNYLKHGGNNESLISTQKNSDLKLYNILNHYRWNIHHVLELDVLVIFTVRNGVFRLIGAYSKTNFNLMQLLEIIVPHGVYRVEFGFVPRIKGEIGVIAIDKLNDPSDLVVASKLYIKEITFKLDNIKVLFPLLARLK